MEASCRLVMPDLGEPVPKRGSNVSVQGASGRPDVARCACAVLGSPALLGHRFRIGPESVRPAIAKCDNAGCFAVVRVRPLHQAHRSCAPRRKTLNDFAVVCFVKVVSNWPQANDSHARVLTLREQLRRRAQSSARAQTVRGASARVQVQCPPLTAAGSTSRMRGPIASRNTRSLSGS